MQVNDRRRGDRPKFSSGRGLGGDVRFVWLWLLDAKLLPLAHALWHPHQGMCRQWRHAQAAFCLMNSERFAILSVQQGCPNPVSSQAWGTGQGEATVAVCLCLFVQYHFSMNKIAAQEFVVVTKAF